MIREIAVICLVTVIDPAFLYCTQGMPGGCRDLFDEGGRRAVGSAVIDAAGVVTAFHFKARVDVDKGPDVIVRCVV